jgi:hypothetical protein
MTYSLVLTSGTLRDGEIELQSSFTNVGGMYRCGLALFALSTIEYDIKMVQSISCSHASICYIIWSSKIFMCSFLTIYIEIKVIFPVTFF